MDGGSQDERVLEPSGIENLKNDTCRSAANIVAQAGNLQSRIHSRWSACCRKMATSPLSSFPFDSSQTTNLLRTTSCCWHTIQWCYQKRSAKRSKKARSSTATKGPHLK